ncbi:MAG: hypothetical protein JNL70_21980 [Saprospiraceae bacterium]|nr:hypothetical protein [Saprospiraceae bacterium]
MTIGLTYDLRTDYLAEGYSLEETAEFDDESTIEGIEQAIQKAGHQTERIGHARHLMARLLKGDTWDMVFNITEGLYGGGRESLVPALLDAYRIPYVFSDAVTMALTLNKAFAKQIVRDAGVNTAAFHVVYREEDIAQIDLVFPLFAKPISEGTGKGVDTASKIETPEELEIVCRRLLKTFNQAVLVEEYLPGREFTVGILGTGADAFVAGAMECVFTNGQDVLLSLENKDIWESIMNLVAVEGDILEACKDMALKSWRALNCYDGGRMDAKIDRHGNLSFIEMNPLAGLHPTSSYMPILCRMNGLSYQKVIETILESATKRHFGI